MDDFSNNWCIFSWTRMHCIFSIFLTAVFAAEKQMISAVVGSSVTLHCSKSIGNLSLATWKTDKSTIFTYGPDIISNVSSINRKMLTSESELYALVMDNIQKSDAQNYTCEINTNKGFWEMPYELIVKDKVGEKAAFSNLVLVIVPFVFLLMLPLSWILLRKGCKHQESNMVSPGTRLDSDCVYENYLEGEKRVQAVIVTNEDYSEIRGFHY